MSLNARQSTESRQSEIIATVVALAAERNPAEVTTTDIAKAMSVTQGHCSVTFRPKRQFAWLSSNGLKRN